MKTILKTELNTPSEVFQYIEDNHLLDIDYHLAVIALLTNQQEEVILQRRGPKSRDEINTLADIGGAVEDSDTTIKSALMREIKEEVGDSANIKIDNFIVGVLENKYDSHTNQYINWLFLIYKCTYIDGELKNNEEGKCLGYENYSLNKLPLTDMTKTSQYFWDYYQNKYQKCYSYAMGVNESILSLQDKNFIIKEDTGDYEVMFSNENASKWENYIINNMECGFWNEYLIDDKIKYIFKELDGKINTYILNRENNSFILDKCCQFAEQNFTTVKEMYLENAFYQKQLDGIIFYD